MKMSDYYCHHHNCSKCCKSPFVVAASCLDVSSVVGGVSADFGDVRRGFADGSDVDIGAVIAASDRPYSRFEDEI